MPKRRVPLRPSRQPRSIEAEPPTEPIRLVVVESRPLVGAGVREVLDREPDIEVVASVSSSDDAVRVVDEASPHVILVDTTLAAPSDVEAARRLHRATPESALVVLGGESDATTTVGAVEAGAVAHLPEIADATDLVSTIRRVAEGEDPLKDHLVANPKLIERVVDTIRESALAEPPLPNPLTPREQEILALVAAGRRNREIAEELEVSEQTVKNHMTAILGKLRVSRRRDAAAVARRRGWVEPPA